MSRLSS